MDAKTYPNGILEEMEACPNKMEESTETWNNKLQRGDVGKCKVRLLTNSGKPYHKSGPFKPKA